MAKYTPGKMDIRAQEKTFDAFMRFVAWGTVIVFGVLIFLALANA